MKKLSFQKIFNFISFLFILSCCIFYGTRFIKYYLESKKTEIIKKNSLVKVIKENNNENEEFFPQYSSNPTIERKMPNETNFCSHLCLYSGEIRGIIL